VKAVYNFVLEGKEQVRKLPSSKKAWEVIGNKLQLVADFLLPHASSQQGSTFWACWNESKVSKVLVDLLFTLLNQFERVDLASLPKPRQVELLPAACARYCTL